jgi:hypothetical protein
MRDDENASLFKGKTSRAFYPELPDEVALFDSLYSLQKARIEEEAEEGQRKPKSGTFSKRRERPRSPGADSEPSRTYLVFAIPVLPVSSIARPERPRTRGNVYRRLWADHDLR